MDRKRNLFCYLMVTPALLFTLILGVYPMLDTLRISLLRYDLLRMRTEGTPFIGLQNYVTVFQDPRFVQTLINTIMFTILAVATVVTLALFLAQVLNQNFSGRGLVRTLVCVPWFVPPAVASVAWMWLFQTERSPINYLLQDMGLIGSNIRFLTDTTTFGPTSIPMLSVTAVRVWNGLPFVLIFILAGLQSIPRDVYEAAAIDGANTIQKFFHVTLPMLKPVLGIVIVLLVMGGIGHFEINYIMTGGGPQNLTNILAVFSYQQGFMFYKFGIAAAANGVILILTGIICFFYIRSQVKRP